MTDFYQESLDIHRQCGGKISLSSKVSLENSDDLAIAYTPGVAAPCEAIYEDSSQASTLTIKGNSVAVVSDGSAVLGLGNIGPLAAIPVMEGKALLFKKFGGIDAWPICLDTQDAVEIVDVVRKIAPVFGAINLEDIAAPKCFDIERDLQDLGIPVFHDDQDGTAIVVMAGLINACKVLERDFSSLKVVICGSGAAGVAIARFLSGGAFHNGDSVEDIIMVDSCGIISASRSDLSRAKRDLLKFTNSNNVEGALRDAMVGADVFVGVSKGDMLQSEDISLMAKGAIIFALANPTPEIMPDDAFRGGAAIVATGRSDFPNQINNVLAFPGIFRGALDARALRITQEMKRAATYSLAGIVVPTSQKLLPDPLEKNVAYDVAKAVKAASLRQSFSEIPPI